MIQTARNTRIVRADLSKDLVAHYAAPRRRPAKVWRDSSRNKQHGTLIGMTPETAWQTSPYLWALQFNNNWVDLNRAWAFTDFSFACWFKIPNLTTDHSIAGNWNGVAIQGGFQIWFDANAATVGGTDVISFVIFGDAAVANWLWVASSSLTAAGWYHVGVTRQDGVDARVFVNGIYDTPLGQNANRVVTIDDGENVRLGRVASVTAGTITESAFWERAISDSEIHDHFLRTRRQPHSRVGSILARSRATRRFRGLERMALDLSGDHAIIDGKVNITLNAAVINDVVMLQSKLKEGGPTEGGYLHRETKFQLPTTGDISPKVGDTVTVADVTYNVLKVRQPFLGDYWGLTTREVSITADTDLQNLITLWPAVNITDAGGFKRTSHPSASADFLDVPAKIQLQPSKGKDESGKRGFKRSYAIYVSAEVPLLKVDDLLKDEDSKQYVIESWKNRSRIDEFSVIICNTGVGE